MALNEVGLKNQTVRIRDELYTLTDRRGNGKFGSVWASTTPSGRRAAVKVINLRDRRNNFYTSHLVRSFQNEVRMAYKMRDARNYVVTIYGFDVDIPRGLALMAMELGNDSLKDRVENLHHMHSKSKKTGYDYISAKDRKNIWVQLVNIVFALHHRHVIHRDIKPDNLVFFGPVLKVVDLGIAQDGAGKQTPHQIRINSAYSAPECLTGEAPITSKADIWSLGAILYHLTYGKGPMQRTAQAPFGVRQTRSMLVEDIVYHCLQRNIYQRARHNWLLHHPLTHSKALM